MTARKTRDFNRPSNVKVRAEPQRTRNAKLGTILGAVFLCGAAWAVDITTDTRIDATNVGTYQSVPLAVAAGATLTIDLAPTAEQVFSGAVSGAGQIVVVNTGTKPIRFSGSFQAFTGALSATGTVQVGGLWQAVALNGTLSGVTVFGAVNNTMTFYGPNVFGTGGGGGVPSILGTDRIRARRLTSRASIRRLPICICMAVPISWEMPTARRRFTC